MKLGVIAGTSSCRSISDFLENQNIEYSVHLKKGYLFSECSKITGQISYFFPAGKKVGVCIGKKRYMVSRSEICFSK
nr:hypothetical protein [Petrotogaceae bacterium]